MAKAVTTKFGEKLKVGDTVYYVDYSVFDVDKASIEVVLQEVVIEDIESRLNYLQIHGPHKAIANFIFADEIKIEREKNPGRQYPGGYFYEKKSPKRFFTNLVEAKVAFKNKYKSLFMKRKTIKAVFKGTGHTYGRGDEWVGYKLILYRMPK